MNSAGPSFAALIIEDKIDVLKNIYKKHNYQLLVLEVDNKGGQQIT